MNIYQKCPTLESEKFIFRLIRSNDTAELFKVYSDERAVPFFNGDNCNGDNFYYQTMERMQQAVDFWIYSYETRWFVRWTIIDKKTNEAIGTIEAFHRNAEDFYDDYGLFRLDLRSDYEDKECITDILEILVPCMYQYFDCDKCMTKAVTDAVNRTDALRDYGFKKSDIPMIGGEDGKEYYDYWIINK